MRRLCLSTCRVWSVGGIFSLFGPQRCLHSIEVGFLLELANVLLVANPLVAKPIGDLKDMTTVGT